MENCWIEDTLPQTISILTTLPFKAQFSALTTNADRVQFCLAQKEVQRWVGLFVSNFVSNPNRLKCSTTARKYREDGNDSFRGQNFESAIQLYSRAICFAPKSEDKTASELALAFGNRSAAYFQLGLYDNALKDINAALSLGYGQFKSATKLQLRKCDCLIRLGRASEAEELLHFMQKPTGDESDAKRWIELFGRINLDDDKKKEKKESIPKVCNVSLIEKLTNEGLFKSNQKMSSFSAKVAVQYDEVKGRHLVAQEDIEFGDILAISKPYVTLLDSNNHVLKYCHHCCGDIFPESTLIRPVPCNACSSVYCSEECRTESANSYHRYECGQHDLLVQLPKFPQMALRLLYRAGMDQICSVIDSSENKKHISEQAEGHYFHVYQLVHHSNGPLKDLNIPYEEMLKSSILACLLLQLVKKSNFPIDSKEEEKLIGGILLRHILQLRFNTFDLTSLDKEYEPEEPKSASPHILLDLYPLFASTLNHSCRANARLESAKGQSGLLLQAARPISAGTEITIPYFIGDYGPFSMCKIHEKLWYQYHFQCICAECEYQSRNIPFGLSKQYPYYPVSCSKCSNLMELVSERGSESEIFRCTACPLVMTNAEMKQRYIKIEQLKSMFNQISKEISGPTMTWRYIKSIIAQLEKLLHHFSTEPIYRRIAISYLSAGQLEDWSICNERIFSAIDYLYGTENVQFIEAYVKASFDRKVIRLLLLNKDPITVEDLQFFMRNPLYRKYEARSEQWMQLERKYKLKLDY